jgi:hypothetical protein
MRVHFGCYHIGMARKHTKAARPSKPATPTKPSIVRKAATPTLAVRFDGRDIPIGTPEKACQLLSELCQTATQNIQTFHAVQREVEAQRMKMREMARAPGIDTDEVLRRCEKSGYPCCRSTIDRAIAAGELPAFNTIGLAGRYRMIRPEDFEKWNRARIARITRKEAP